MKFGKSEKDITPHLLIAAIAAMLLYVAASWWAGSGESQQSAPTPEAKPEAPTAEAPDISIQQAAYEGNIEAVKQHLADGVDVNTKDKDGFTPLHYATGRGRKEVAELLIAKGADVNAKGDRDATPLHGAAFNGHAEIVELLIDAGADVNAQLNDGKTPLDVASGKTATLLRKHGGKTGEELKAEGK